MAKAEFALLEDPTGSVAMRGAARLPDRIDALPVDAYEDEPELEMREAWVRSLDLAGTTPTFLPDLLRDISRQADEMARDPLNQLDNNPYITREWLIVSQILHAAAATMEKRFELLFLGL